MFNFYFIFWSIFWLQKWSVELARGFWTMSKQRSQRIKENLPNFRWCFINASSSNKIGNKIVGEDLIKIKREAAAVVNVHSYHTSSFRQVFVAYRGGHYNFFHRFNKIFMIFSIDIFCDFSNLMNLKNLMQTRAQKVWDFSDDNKNVWNNFANWSNCLLIIVLFYLLFFRNKR